MNDLIAVKRQAEWEKIKRSLLDSVSSSDYAARLQHGVERIRHLVSAGAGTGFSKTTVSAWRASIEARKLGRRPSSSGCQRSEA